MGLIRIEGMEFYAYHGHFKEEQIVGNDFIVDLSLETNLEPASRTDQIEDAVDYQQIYKLVQNEMNIPSALLEHIAKRIIDAIYAEFAQQITWLEVKISKMNPPLSGKIKNVSIVMHR